MTNLEYLVKYLREDEGLDEETISEVILENFDRSNEEEFDVNETLYLVVDTETVKEYKRDQAEDWYRAEIATLIGGYSSIPYALKEAINNYKEEIILETSELMDIDELEFYYYKTSIGNVHIFTTDN